MTLLRVASVTVTSGGQMKKITILVGAAVAWLGNCVALAQNDPPASRPLPPGAADSTAIAASNSSLEEIVVTAEKRSERLSDVPLSITAVTGAELARKGVNSVGDLEKVVPGFVYTQSPYGAPIYSIRGIGFFSESVGIAPTVSVYVDEVPIAFTRATEGASLDLERVEVLKGPQGTLFGQNSTGGAVNYIAAKPTDTLQAGGEVTYGRFNEVDIESFVSGPIAPAVTARFAFQTNQRDGWQYSTSDHSSLGVQDFTTARLLLDWKPVDELTYEFNLNGWKDKSDSQANQFQSYSSSAPGNTGYPGSVAYPNIEATLLARPPAPANDRAADWNPGNYRRDDDFYQGSARGDLAIAGAVTLTSITEISKLLVHSPSDVDGTDLPVFAFNLDAFTESYSQEFRLSSIADNSLRWIVGANYEYDKVSDRNFLDDQGSNSGVGPFRFTMFENDAGNQHIRTSAGFGGLDWHVTHTLTAQASARYTKQDHDLTGCLRSVPGGGLDTAFGFLSTLLNGDPHVPAPGEPSYIAPTGCATLNAVTNLPGSVSKSLDESNVSWRAGLSWKPDANSLVYGNITRGFKGGAFETIPAIRPAQMDSVPQEEITAYELGARGRLFSGAIDLSGAVFHYDYKDKQLLGYISDDFFGNLPGLVSVPKSRVDGVEASLVFRPLTDWYVSLGGTYLDTSVRSDFYTVGPIATSGTINVKGEAFPDTPKLSALLDTEYRFPLLSNWEGFVGGNATYHGRNTSTFAAPSEFDIDGYTLLDARLGMARADGKLRIQLWGKNITDKYYWTHVDHVLDTITRVTGMPATFGISVFWKL